MVSLVSVLFVLERLVLQRVPGFQFSSLVLAVALLVSLLISGYVVYINAIAEHQSEVQSRDERLGDCRSPVFGSGELEALGRRVLVQPQDEGGLVDDQVIGLAAGRVNAQDVGGAGPLRPGDPGQVGELGIAHDRDWEPGQFLDVLQYTLGVIKKVHGLPFRLLSTPSCSHPTHP